MSPSPHHLISSLLFSLTTNVSLLSLPPPSSWKMLSQLTTPTRKISMPLFLLVWANLVPVVLVWRKNNPFFGKDPDPLITSTHLGATWVANPPLPTSLTWIVSTWHDLNHSLRISFSNAKRPSFYKWRDSPQLNRGAQMLFYFIILILYLSL